MTTIPDELLRPLVAQAVRSALTDLRPSTPVPQPSSRPTSPTAEVTPAAGGRTVERVRLTDDRDVDAFVRRIVSLSANPRTRQQLVSGQLRFALDGAAGGPAAPLRAGAAQRVESGAVTERTIVELAKRGEGLLLGRRAVLTPLARDRARALGVRIEKEN